MSSAGGEVVGRIPEIELWQVRIANSQHRIEVLEAAKAALESSGVAEVVTRNLVAFGQAHQLIDEGHPRMPSLAKGSRVRFDEGLAEGFA